MKLKSLITAIAALAIGANFAIAAEEDTPLAKQMSAFNKSLRTLKRQANDASKKADNLAILAKMKENMANAAKLEPLKTKDQPAGDKAAYVEKFKKQIAEVDKTLDTLKAAIEKGDAAEIQATFDKLSDEKEKGHKDFAPDE
jgi:soluble cytochrome b562